MTDYNAPTDDEREALEQAILDGLNAHQAQSSMDPTLVEERVGDAVWAAGFRRSEVPQPSAEGPHSRACGIRKHDHGDACHSNCPTCHGESPQGEPSDAQVLAALNAEDNMRAVQGGYKPREKPEPLSAWKAHDIERMRSVVGAALRAAGGVR